MRLILIYMAVFVVLAFSAKFYEYGDWVLLGWCGLGAVFTIYGIIRAILNVIKD